MSSVKAVGSNRRTALTLMYKVQIEKEETQHVLHTLGAFSRGPTATLNPLGAPHLLSYAQQAAAKPELVWTAADRSMVARPGD